jgi:predicted ribonuclease YlaK
MAGKNREKQQANKKAKRDDQQAHKVADDARKFDSHFHLDWFEPTPIQEDIIDSYYYNDLTCVQGSSGTGKSTTVIHTALEEIKARRYERIVFCKTPAELGDDKIGFLTGGADEKLVMHFESMRSIFHTMMTKEKLVMEEKAGNIQFTIPNFIAGKTIDHTLFIIDEAQLLSPGTVKLLLERAGKGTKVFLLGDKHQNYAVKGREDGFTNFVKRITKVDEEGERVSRIGGMGYVEMKSGDNMRSALSQAITELYEEE